MKKKKNKKKKKKIKKGEKKMKFISEKDYWENETKEVTCSEVEKKNSVFITEKVARKVSFLIRKFPSIEWSGDLIGYEDEKGFVVLDFEIPPQKVTSTTVTPERKSMPKDCIGVIHSHHSMGLGFSGTDKEFANGNHTVSILVAKESCMLGWKSKATVKVKTPCGKQARFDANVLLVDYEGEDKAWEDEAKNIKEEKYTHMFSGVAHYNYGNEFGYFGNSQSLWGEEEDLDIIKGKSCGKCHSCGKDDIVYSEQGEYCRDCGSIAKPTYHGWKKPNEFSSCQIVAEKIKKKEASI